jgi:hypothetical protein
MKPLTPEKLVEKEVLEACKQLNIDVDVIESKATFSKNLGRYTQSRSAPEGMSDLVGNDREGLSVYIELKARGKLRTLRPKQKAFLLRKIENNCFAVCVDSADLLFELYYQFFRSGDDLRAGREVLLNHLHSISPEA